jgi:hypothetical protein
MTAPPSPAAAAALVRIAAPDARHALAAGTAAAAHEAGVAVVTCSGAMVDGPASNGGGKGRAADLSPPLFPYLSL